MKVKEQWVVVSWKEVVRYFADGFKLPKGQNVSSVEAFKDGDKVAFRLTVTSEKG